MKYSHHSEELSFHMKMYNRKQNLTQKFGNLLKIR